jgi:LacI family transcriptional regulator, galactose operon repressor
LAQRRRATVVMVAERAGVSIASVSRVLNGLPTSDDVRASVLDAAAHLDYVPDAVARSLKVGRTEQVALAVADVGNPVYVSMMHAISDVLVTAGYRLVIASTGAQPDDQLGILDSLNRGYCDGLILIPLRITDELIAALTATRHPVVVIGTLPPGVGLDNVRADSPAGVGLALAHLAAHGRRRVAFVNGPVDTVPGSARLSGFVQHAAELGLATSAEMQVEADDFTHDAGVPAVEELLAQATPDAIVCANDLLAVAAIKVLRQHGVSVPGDVAVVGMDDTDICELVVPTLTSVNLGSQQRAAAAARLLLERLDDPERPARLVTVEPTLTIRESSLGDRPSRRQ